MQVKSRSSSILPSSARRSCAVDRPAGGYNRSPHVLNCWPLSGVVRNRFISQAPETLELPESTVLFHAEDVFPSRGYQK
jgi:hypothetical protein